MPTLPLASLPPESLDELRRQYRQLERSAVLAALEQFLRGRGDWLQTLVPIAGARIYLHHGYRVGLVVDVVGKAIDTSTVQDLQGVFPRVAAAGLARPQNIVGLALSTHPSPAACYLSGHLAHADRERFFAGLPPEHEVVAVVRAGVELVAELARTGRAA